jgi:SRSO17 transposase
VPKKNSWGLAEYLGLATPQPLEHLLNGAVWDADALRDAVRSYALQGLGDPQATLVLDDTQAIKKGDKSVGVAPQHCGLTGQVENCQCMVMLTYASVHGHAFIDRELYLPEAWASDRQRCEEAGVPAGRGLVTKPHLGVTMLRRALDDPAMRFTWLVTDSGFGRDPVLRQFCHDRRMTYAMAEPVDLPLVGIRGEALRPDDLLAATPRGAWRRRSCGDGAKGARYYDWATHAVSVKDQPPADGFAHTLLIRRSTRPKVTKKHPEGRYEVEYFLVHAPVGTPASEMVAAAGSRWNIVMRSVKVSSPVAVSREVVRRQRRCLMAGSRAGRVLGPVCGPRTRVGLGRAYPSIRRSAVASCSGHMDHENMQVTGL